MTDMNAIIRQGAGRRRWTVSPDGVEFNDDSMSDRAEEAEDAGPAPFPDLGQGPRGTVPVRGPVDMSARLRRQRDWARSGWGDLHPGDDAA